MLEGLPVEHFLGDVLEPEAVARAVAGCDLVFHVAAVASYWRTQREQVYKVNVEGTRIVMEACLAAGVPRAVHTSSVAAIGIPRNGRPADESATFDAFSATFAYADSKHRAEAVVLQAVARGLPAVIVNPGAIYGAGDHNLISGSMVLELARRSVPLVPDGGLCVVDIDAVVQGHLAAAERGRIGERYILGGENLTSLGDCDGNLRGGWAAGAARDCAGLDLTSGRARCGCIQPSGTWPSRGQRRTDPHGRAEGVLRYDQGCART